MGTETRGTRAEQYPFEQATASQEFSGQGPDMIGNYGRAWVDLMSWVLPGLKPQGAYYVGRVAENLAEKLAMESAMAGGGTRIMSGPFADAAYMTSGWEKWQVTQRNVVVHYMKNIQTGAREQFKFK